MIPYDNFYTSDMHSIFFDMAVIQMPLAQIKLLSLIKYGDADITREIDYENYLLHKTIFVVDDNTVFCGNILSQKGGFCPMYYYHAEYSTAFYTHEYGEPIKIYNKRGYGFGSYGRSLIYNTCYNGQSASMIQSEADE